MDVSAETDLFPMLRILLATALGAAVGWERESIDRPAGLRTHMTVALAAALFTVLAQRLVDTANIEGVSELDPTRALQAVVTGVSFLGAGTIFSARDNSTVKGLTTAAALLATAGIGMAAALASYVLAVGCTALLLVVLGLVRRLERSKHKENPEGGERAAPARVPSSARASGLGSS